MADGLFDKISKAAREAAELAGEAWRRFIGKEVVVYPTYAYRDRRDPSMWVVPVRLWVHDNIDAPFLEDLIENKAIRHFEEDLQRPLEEEEKSRLKRCLTDFLTDDKSYEQVELTFESDDEGRLFHATHTTNRNGLVEENLHVPASAVEQLLGRQEEPSRWLRLRAVTAGGEGHGRVRLLDGRGLSVISDIDDTIKVTHVPAGKKTVLRNIFLKKFEPAPGMLEMYRALGAEGEPPADLSFHYVSGSPWQMFRPLHHFLIEECGHAPGTFHMKNLRKNLTDLDSLRDIKAFAIGGDLATLEQKIRQITNLMVNLPEREFILVGDSGEKDPEVYRAIQELFPDRVREIHIRDVMHERLRGMNRITGADVAISLDTSELIGEMKQFIRQTEETPEEEKETKL